VQLIQVVKRLPLPAPLILGTVSRAALHHRARRRCLARSPSPLVFSGAVFLHGRHRASSGFFFAATFEFFFGRCANRD
jgi:hypothetical protein